MSPTIYVLLRAHETVTRFRRFWRRRQGRCPNCAAPVILGGLAARHDWCSKECGWAREYTDVGVVENFPGDPVILLCGTAPRENVDDGPKESCPKCGDSLCPKCGNHCTQGYGLAFGGMGFYTACLDESCGWFHKTQEDMNLQS